MPHRQPLVACLVVLSLAQVVSAVEAPGWSGFEAGSWRVLRYSSRFGERPPQFEQVIRQTLTGFDSYGRPEFEVERLSGDEGDPAIELYRGAQTPEAWGLELRGEPEPTTVEVLGRTISARVKTYEGSDLGADRIRVIVEESDQVRLFPRVLSQWQTDTGFLLGPGVVRAVSERVDSRGTILTVQQDLLATGTPIEVGDRTVTSVVTRSRSYYQSPGSERGDPRQEVTRWLSPEVPGHLVRHVADLGAETRTSELLDFGAAGTSGATDPEDSTSEPVGAVSEPASSSRSWSSARRGPFELYEELRCQVELEIQVERVTVKEDLLADAEQIFDAVLERHYTFEEARSSPLWNSKEILE